MIMRGEDISEIFSIFHDGVIAASGIANGKLELEVEIGYLTKRINPSYTKFFLSLHNARDFSFSTWPKEVDAAPSVIRDPSLIFAGRPDILSSEIKDGLVEVVMNQNSASFDYCGGTLLFRVDAARVSDEGGKDYEVGELGRICEEYWAEWSNSRSKT